MTEQRIAYSLDVIQKVGNYLLTRPMIEVRHLVEALEKQGVTVDTPIEVVED